jgi:hypothetical protein
MLPDVTAAAEHSPAGGCGPSCLFASTLELLAAELKLPGEDEARQIRRTFVPDTIPDEQRLDTLSREGDRD